MKNKLLIKAKNFATQKHQTQLRDDGKTPYIIHPQQTFEILSIVCPTDINLLAAAWLHDVIEDQNVTYEELVKEFNTDIADLVKEVTKVKPDKHLAAYFPNLHTQRGILLKFADRLSN